MKSVSKILLAALLALPITVTFSNSSIGSDIQMFPPEDGHNECTGNSDVKVLTVKAGNSKTECVSVEKFLAQGMVEAGCAPGQILILSATNPSGIGCK